METGKNAVSWSVAWHRFGPGIELGFLFFYFFTVYIYRFGELFVAYLHSWWAFFYLTYRWLSIFSLFLKHVFRFTWLPFISITFIGNY